MKKGTKNEVASTEVETKPMASHKDTKQYAENMESAEALKETTTEPKKLTRAQQRAAIMDQMAKISGNDVGKADTLLHKYIQMFGLNSAEDLVTMVQSVDEESSTIILKSGFVLPLNPANVQDDLAEFLDIMNAVLDPDGKSLAVNLIKFDMENPDFDYRTKMAFYLLNQFLGFGRKTPNYDFNTIEHLPYPVEDIGNYEQVYAFLEQVIEKPDELAGQFKGLVNSLVPNVVSAMGPLWSRDSLKKLGITFTSAAEGRDIPYHNVMATNIAYLCYDLWAELPEEEENPVADDDGDEENYVDLGEHDGKEVIRDEPKSKFVDDEESSEHEESYDDEEYVDVDDEEL